MLDSLKDVALGAVFTTGQKCPESGVYESIGHMDYTRCNATPSERTIPLAKEEIFPPHKSCKKGVFWKLVEYA